MIRFSKGVRYNGRTRAVYASHGKYTLGFGINKWPWVTRWHFYNTFLAQIIDETGFFQWLVHVKIKARDGYKFFHVRFLCVSVGFKWETLAGEVTP